MSGKAIFSTYFKHLTAIVRQGDAREESFYPALAEMLKEMARSAGKTDVHVTTLPRPTEGGNPDFRLWNGTDRIIGYIEAKKPAEERLDIIEDSEQLKRYRATFPNLILTNFLEFRLYRNGDLVETVLAGRPMVLNALSKTPPLEKPDELYALLDRFFDFVLPQTFTAESLAIELAKRTRLLRNVINEQFQHEQEVSQPAAPGNGILSSFFEAFQTYLIGSMTPEDFADLFAQTITYGLFVARTRAGDSFNRRVAFDNIPHTIGVLRDLFRFISLDDLPDPLAWCVDDLAEVLSVADAQGILDRYYREGKGSDPIVHFYETFLGQYDPDERERRGVYYTPEPVVGYIVRSLHGLLKMEFSKHDGLASDGVTLLDPAAGTMTFVARAAQQAVAEFEAKYGSGGRADFIRRHILRNFYALELMMAPYAVGHLKMSFFLNELGHRLTDDERMPFYLTNTLDTEELEQSRLPGLSALAEESRLAGVVKQKTPILCILGNPPYSYHSSNRGNWITGLIADYKKVDGEVVGKNSRGLQDDYVKFLRFAQWKIEQAGCGAVGMITNHSYLDNLTFCGMRRSLMRTFDDIYVLDLHGNALKRESCPDGSPDKNVFDIRQGVAIAFFVKRGSDRYAEAIVHYAELYGTRESKYVYLDAHDCGHTKWRELTPHSPSYLFVPRDDSLEANYLRFTSVSEVFSESVVGLFTARDNLTIRWSAEDAWKTVTVFSRMDPELAREGYKLGNDTQDWKVPMAQKDLLDPGLMREKVVPILYRPFDVRYTYYTGRSRGFICRPRPSFMRHMLAGENLALITSRLTKGESFGHALVTEHIAEKILLSSKTSNNAFLFPLYLYPSADPSDLFSRHKVSERQPNLKPDLIAALLTAYGGEPSPEAILHYIYAVLYAPTYRAKYAEFLRMDFPRVPFTSDGDLFAQLAAFGKRLKDLHMLTSPELNPPTCRFNGAGHSVVAKTKAQGYRYEANEQRMYINKAQYFGPIPLEIYEYRIGGYQVCDKWLQDRKERRLDLDDIRTYCWIVTAIGLTITIQEQIDALYLEAERHFLQVTAEMTEDQSSR